MHRNSNVSEIKNIIRQSATRRYSVIEQRTTFSLLRVNFNSILIQNNDNINYIQLCPVLFSKFCVFYRVIRIIENFLSNFCFQISSSVNSVVVA